MRCLVTLTHKTHTAILDLQILEAPTTTLQARHLQVLIAMKPVLPLQEHTTTMTFLHLDLTTTPIVTEITCLGPLEQLAAFRVLFEGNLIPLEQEHTLTVLVLMVGILIQ
jgi:hypothetical protein